jgi:hypothetical protein
MTETMTETEAPPALVVGQRYRVNTDSAMGATVRLGATVQCVRELGLGSFRFQEVNDQDVPEGHEWYFTAAYLDPLPTTVTVTEQFVPVVITQEQYDTVVREREEARAQLAAERQTHRSYVNNVSTDMVTINEVWADAAQRNDLCGVYDTTIERSNGRCSVLFFDAREVDYDVTWQETYTVTVTRSGNFTGVRGDDDGNSERAEEVRDNSEGLEERELIELLRDNGNHEFQDYVDDSLEWDAS